MTEGLRSDETESLPVPPADAVPPIADAVEAESELITSVEQPATVEAEAPAVVVAQAQPIASELTSGIQFGASLRSVREAAGLTTAEVAGQLKIGVRKIDALETEQWEILPQGAYLRGLVRNYTKILGLSAVPFLEELERKFGSEKPLERLVANSHSLETPFPRNAGRFDDSRGGRWMLVGAIALVLIAAGIYWTGTESFRDTRTAIDGWFASLTSKPSEKTPAPISEKIPGEKSTGAEAGAGEPAPLTATMQVDVLPTAKPAPVDNAPGALAGGVPAASPANVSGSSNIAANVAASVPSAAGDTKVDASRAAAQSATLSGASVTANSAVPRSPATLLQFKFSGDSWVEVKQQDGKVLFSQMNTANSERGVDGKPPFDILIGNASGVSLRYRGQPVTLVPHGHDNVVRLTLQ